MAERILIIDDEPKIGQMISDILRDEGYEPIIALDAERGLESTRKNDFGLVLLDLKLPDKDGLDVLKEISALKPNLPVVIISAHGNIKTAVQTTKMGAFDFLEKPLDMDRLLITVRNALQQEKLKAEITRLRSETLKQYQMIGTSPAMQKIYDLIDKAAGVKSSVLVTGANGTGKELAAKAVHYNSPRQEKPFIKINCAAVPETLLESELFGYEKGAFTGASGTKKGKLEQAEGGTVFLDEIGDMSLALQAKLLRFLQDGEIQPLGGAQTKTVDARVIAASNQNLDLAKGEAVPGGPFLPPECYPDQDATPQGAKRRHPAPGQTLHGRVLPGERGHGENLERCGDVSTHQLRLAGERASGAEHRGAISRALPKADNRTRGPGSRAGDGQGEGCRGNRGWPLGGGQAQVRAGLHPRDPDPDPVERAQGRGGLRDGPDEPVPEDEATRDRDKNGVEGRR